MTLVLKKRNIQLTLLAVILVASVVTTVFQKEIRIAYHKNRLLTAARYWQLGNPSMGVSPPPRPSLFEMIALSFGRGQVPRETERTEHHTKALVKLGYFATQEFPLHNRQYVAGTNIVMFCQLTVERFDFGKPLGLTNDWWALTGTESNKIVVTTTRALLPKWRKLVEDFDQP
jgi:hypothetical protein